MIATDRPLDAIAARLAPKLVLVVALGLAWGAPAFAQAESEEKTTDPRDAWLEGDDEDEIAPEEAEPAVPGADLGPASALVREGKLDEAEANLEALRQEFPEDPGLLLLLGEVRVAAGRFDEAIPVLQRSIEIGPDNARAHFQLGTALASTGDLEGGLDAFDGVLTRSEDSSTLVLTRFNRSLLLQRLSRWGDAAQELEAVLQFEPDRTQVYGDLASLYVQANDPGAALRALQRGEDAGFASAIHWYSVGALLFQSDRLDDARTAFERSLAIDPRRAEAERSLGAVLDRLGRTEEAASHLRRYLELRPDAADRAQVEAQLDSYGRGAR